jgi:RNA polymerase sigma factor (sigma-70 family)
MTELYQDLQRVRTTQGEAQRLAFEKVDARYRRPLHVAALRITRDTFLAEDLVQETLLRAYVALSTGKFKVVQGRERRFFHWLIRVAKSIWVDERRTDARRQEKELIAAKSLVPPRMQPTRGTESNTIRKIQERLSPRQLAAVQMYYSGDGTTQSLIANELGCSTSTVSRDLRQANLLLAEKQGHAEQITCSTES